jgi:hypothetical protein
MFARRRPLLRAAAVGGGAYLAGKSRQRHNTEQQEYQADQESRISDLEQNQAKGAQQPPPQAAAEQAKPSMSDQIQQLSTLHQQGALTDEEFAAAKAKLLGI